MDLKNEIKTIVKSRESLEVFNFEKSNFNSGKLVIYIFVDDDIKEEKESIQFFLQDYIKSVFNKENTLYCEISPNSSSKELYQKIQDELENKEIYEIDTKNKVVIVPVFVQRNSFDSVFGIFQEFYNQLMSYFENRRATELRCQPAAIIRTQGAREQDEFMSKILRWSKNTTFNNLPLLILSSYDSNGHKLNDKKLVQALCYTVTITTSSLTTTEHTTGIGEYGQKDLCFSARLVTINLPYHYGMLWCVGSLLKYFMTEETNQEKLEKLGNSLSELPRESVWSHYSELPLKDDKINILPVYSLTIPDNMPETRIEDIFDDFTEEYYLSKMPLDFPENTEDIIDELFKKYRVGYGDNINGFKYIFNKSMQPEFIQNYIKEISVIDDLGQIDIPVNRAIKDHTNTLHEKIKNRNRSFYKKMFSEDAGWFKKLEKRYSEIMTFLKELNETTIPNEQNTWRNEEGSIPFIIEMKWSEIHRQKLMKFYMEILKSNEEDKEASFRKFCEKLFETAQDFYPVRKDYIEKLKTAYLESKNNPTIFDAKSVHDWKSLLVCPSYAIHPKSDSKEEYHCIYQDQNLQFVKDIVGSGDIIWHQADIQDRIEIIHFSELGTWNFKDSLEEIHEDTE